MGKFKKGNRASVGNKGGRRKSAYEEFMDAQWHKEKWEKNVDVKALERKIKSGRYSVKDMFLWKALMGKERMLANFADKILPNLTMHMNPSGEATEINLSAEARKRLQKYED